MFTSNKHYILEGKYFHALGQSVKLRSQIPQKSLNIEKLTKTPHLCLRLY